jgi:hypothetical protein
LIVGNTNVFSRMSPISKMLVNSIVSWLIMKSS